ncbi:MAG: sulfur carrier protein ThiS [Alphaproteobacteria bacterium]|nr:sulfur carrier protein ThiS [Alphaproteobacteria bacterium]
MEISVNGTVQTTQAATLAALLSDLDYTGVRVATAINDEFVPASSRSTHQLSPGDRVEIVSARQGG